ncbi:MAG: adenylate/guanylate cyclase domain-containing protein, partial [Mesorhizobium sp.]
GYSRLMERDEAGTLEALKKRRKSILQPLLTTHHGRLVKVMGDGVLVEFASAVNAVQCAVELQERMAEANSVVSEARRIILRIGINLGDVMVEGRDLYGDGVNVAARLEGIADPGQICVSGSIYE